VALVSASGTVGSVATVGLIGFGSSSVAPLTVSMVPLFDVSLLPNFAFSVPRTGTITALSAFFSPTVGVTLTGTTTLTATLYSGVQGSNNLSPTPATVVLATLPAGTILTPGSPTFAATVPTAVAVTVGDRFLAVLSATSDSLLGDTITGVFSGGISIV
jgi:BclB C-terminal domain-containing protein